MKIDGRTIDHKTLETIRIMAVRRVHEGEIPSAIMKSYGLCRTSIYRWLRDADAGGQAALMSRKHPGPTPRLTDKQKQQVRKWICGRDPRQYGFDFGLWTRHVVADMVKQKLNKKLSITTVGRLLGELGITPQKPLRRAYERDPQAVEKWKNEDYPKLKKRAKQRDADIFFLDEAGIRSDAPLQRTWGLKGQTPVVKTSGQRQSVSAISAVTARGAFWYSVYTGRLNAAKFIEFLRAFMHHRRKRVFLVIDGLPAHKARMVAAYVQSLKGRLELHFLPGYAPDLNPDEFVWNYLRHHGTTKIPLRKNESLQRRVEQNLAAIKRSPKLVRSFFRAPTVAYTMN